MSQTRLLQNIDTDHEILRCVADAQGKMIYVSPALCWASGETRAELLQVNISRLLTFHDHLGKEVLFSADMKPGFYSVVFERLERDPLLLHARIDKLKRDQQTFFIFWLDQNATAYMRDEVEDRSELLLDRVETLGNIPGKEKIKSAKIENIKDDESELRHFINVSNELFGVYRREGTFLRVNYAFNRILGYPDQDLRKFPFLHLMHPDDRSLAGAKLDVVLNAPPENETRVNFECRSVCKDGQIKWVEWVLKSAGDYIYIVGRDVSDIRDQEARLDAREIQLFEAQKIGRMGHWSWTVGDTAMDWSMQLYYIFDVAQKTFKPDFKSLNALLTSPQSFDIKTFFQRTLLEKKDYTAEFSIQDTEGRPRYIRCEGRCQINDRNGAVEKLFGIFQDVTEAKLHEQELRAAKESAEAAYESKTRFLANMSHELRTPLNAIIGFSEMMQQQLLGPVGNKKYLDYIGGIRESGVHLLDLINDILDMSKIEYGKYDLEFEEMNLAKIIRLVLHMMEGRAHEGGVHLVADSLPDNLHLQADRRAVMQILINILSNAVKFTPEGGRVEILCAPQDSDSISIIVRDTGVGIPKAKIPMITLPFEQVASAHTRPHEGTGLGLAITKDLIGLHHGELAISSRLKKGTEVSVILPLKQSQDRDVEELVTHNESFTSSR